MKIKLFNALLWCIGIGLWIAVWAADFRGSANPEYVKCIRVKSVSPGQSSGTVPETNCINVNTSDGPGLTHLPGIGPSLAERIIQFRKDNGPFKGLEDLDKVKGIGAGKLEKIRSGVCF